MAIDLLSLGIQTGLIAGLLVAFLLSFRHLALKWINMAIARFMGNLSKQAKDEGGSSAGSSGGGALKIAGFEITPELIQSIAQLAQLAQQFGFLKGGTGGGGGPSGL